MGDKELTIPCAHSLNFTGLSGTVQISAHKDLFSSIVCLNVVTREDIISSGVVNLGFIIYLIFMDVLPAFKSVHHCVPDALETRRVQWVSWCWSYR